MLSGLIKLRCRARRRPPRSRVDVFRDVSAHSTLVRMRCADANAFASSVGHGGVSQHGTFLSVEKEFYQGQTIQRKEKP